MAKSTVLVVDDDANFVRGLSARLSFSGYEVRSAFDGMTALEMAARGTRPDLVLLDISMPGMDGHTVAHRLKANPATADIPIVFFTCRTSDEDLESAWRVQAAYVEKSCGIRTLLEQIAATLEAAKSARGDQPPAAEGLPTLVHRVWAEYQEMPGMCLTVQQAQRLFGIDEPACRQILAVLSEMGHLGVTDGRYVRRGGDERVALAPSAASAESTAKPEGAGVRRVLVVDEEDDFRRGLTLRLQASGFVVLTARDGAAATRLAARERPHVVILNVGLPGGDGYATARLLRENPETAEIPIVLLTAKAEPGDTQRAHDVGAAAYLVKPSHDDLIRRMGEVFGTP